MLIDLITLFLILLFYSQIYIYMMNGWLIKDGGLWENEDIINIVNFNPRTGNLYTNITQYNHVGKNSFSILSRYYINGMGVVPRWSKLDRKINTYYIQAKLIHQHVMNNTMTITHYPFTEHINYNITRVSGYTAMYTGETKNNVSKFKFGR